MGGARLTDLSVSSMVIGRDLALDLLEFSRGLGDLLDTVLVLAVINANLAAMSARPELQVAYGDEAVLPPDSVRRPVPISALARSLSLPFETVRRRISKLCRSGLCEMTPSGVIVPSRALAAPAFTEGAHANLAALRGAHRRLAALGVLTPLAEDRPAEPDGLRIAARLSTDYFLRVVDALVRRAGSAVDGFILLQMNRENTRALSDWRGPDGAFADDEHKEPATAAGLARVLRMSPETVRRRLKRLVQEGHCRPVGAGFIVPQAVIVAEFAELRNVIEVNLLRLFRRLEEFGVTRGWSSEPPERPPGTSPDPLELETGKAHRPDQR